LTCANCYHDKDPYHKEGHFCTADLTCTCDHYVAEISEFLNQINAAMASMKTTKSRTKYILQKIPNLRNAGEKSFRTAFKRIVFGLKQNDPIPRGMNKKIPHDDTINRAKRNIQQFNPKLRAYNEKAIIMKGAAQAGILEALYE